MKRLQRMAERLQWYDTEIINKYSTLTYRRHLFLIAVISSLFYGRILYRGFYAQGKS